jgi:hypothetical protein
MDEEKLLHGGIGRAEDDRIQADLDRAITDKLLSSSDAGGSLAKEFEANISLSLPTWAELDRVQDSEADSFRSNQDLQSLLSLDSVGEIAVEGMRLNELLARGGASLEERSILKRGLLFLNHRKYNEAVEWWLLNRPREPFENPRLYCLATLLLSFTYQLSGQMGLAKSAAQEAREVRKLV